MSELPADAVYELARPMSVTVSPDSRRVAVQVLEFDPGAESRRSSVFVVPTDGSRDPHRLTRVSGAGSVAWSPDGTRLGVLMTRERDLELRVGGDTRDDGGTAAAESREADPQPQLWVYDLARGGDPRQVTDFDEGVRGFDWGPAGERVVVAAREPTAAESSYLEQHRDGGPIETERLQHKFDGVGWLDTVTTYLFVVDIESRDRRRLDQAHGGGILEPGTGLSPAWHPEDDRVAFLANRGNRPDDSYAQAVHVVDTSTGETRQLLGGDRMVREPTWSPGGSRLAVVTSSPTNWYAPADVCTIDPDTGRCRTLTDGLDNSSPGSIVTAC